MKAPFTYYGGKAGMADEIVAMMPPHRVYIEPFLGSGAVLFAKRPATHEIVNDIDGAVVAFFRMLRDRPDELARAEFLAADMDALLDDLELARRFWVRVNQSFAKTAGRRTGWSVTTARSQAPPASSRSRIGRFEACAARLAEVSIECCDAASLVERLATTTDTVLYVDPPYLGTVRSNVTTGAKGGMTDYRHDMHDEASHRALAAALHKTPATVILSGYPSPLYDELYEGWPVIDRSVAAHSSASTGTARARRTERIWTNRDLNTGRLCWEAPA